MLALATASRWIRFPKAALGRPIVAGTRPAVVLLATLLLLACATTPRPVADKNLLAFLDGPSVARDDVYRKLGPPHATFEEARIAAFRVSELPTGYYIAEPKLGWDGVRYNLLVEFDAHDIVQSHRLVVVRAP